MPHSAGTKPLLTAVPIKITTLGGTSDVSEVTFGGIRTSFTATSATEITAFLPPNAKSGTFSLVSPYGITTSPKTFTVTQGTESLRRLDAGTPQCPNARGALIRP